MKKVLSHSVHFVNESKNLKERKLKSKKPSKIAMVDAPTVAGLDQVLNMHHGPVKVEFPSTSELLMIEEFRQSLNTSHKRSRGRPRIDFHERPVKIITERKPGIEKIGKRRGRPSKNKGFNERPLNCGLCDFKAENIYELEGHLTTHSNQNMYECPYCNSTFSQKGNLITHIRTHTKEKPFKCLICDFAASQKVNLQVHIRIHTKEKPFKCSICDFSTAQKCNLVAHVTRRHSNVEVVKALETCDNQWGSTDSQLKYYRCGMCMFSCRLKREMVDHVKLQHPFSTLISEKMNQKIGLEHEILMNRSFGSHCQYFPREHSLHIRIQRMEKRATEVCSDMFWELEQLFTASTKIFLISLLRTSCMRISIWHTWN